MSLIVANPSRVKIACIDEMRCQQRSHAIIRNLSLQGNERKLLKNTGPRGIADHLFLDSERAIRRRIGNVKCRNSTFKRAGDGYAVAFFFGKVTLRPSDNKTEIAGAGTVYPRIIDLVQNAVAEREPDRRCFRQRSADPVFGARRPARFYARRARCKIQSGAHHEMSRLR